MVLVLLLLLVLLVLLLLALLLLLLLPAAATAAAATAAAATAAALLLVVGSVAAAAVFGIQNSKLVKEKLGRTIVDQSRTTYIEIWICTTWTSSCVSSAPVYPNATKKWW